MMYYPSQTQQYQSLNTPQKNIFHKLKYLNDIEGWLLLEEAVELYFLAIGIKKSRPIICEIGSWKGKSAYVFASALKDINGVLYCIDPFDGDGDDASKSEYKKEMDRMNISLIENFNKTMEKYNLENVVKVIPTVSQKARDSFEEGCVDLLFIDGSHDYIEVESDFNLWSSLIPTGGKIVLHDVYAVHVDGPKRVVDKYIKNNQDWCDVQVVGEMVVATKN